MRGMIGGPLPEDYRSTMSAFAQYIEKREEASTPPSHQRLASLHRFLVRRYVDDESLSLTSEQRIMIDSGVCFPTRYVFTPNRGSPVVVRTLSEWVEDSRLALEDEDDGHVFSLSANAIASSESRLSSLKGRIRTMLPLLLTTLGNLTADGGLFIMPKNRAEKLTGFFLHSLDETARFAMRFRDAESDEDDSVEEAELRKQDAQRLIASFPKLMEGFRRLKSVANEEDGSDIVVERLLSSIDNLFLESLIVYSCKKSVSEVVRRKKVLREKARASHFSSKQSLLDALKDEVDRIYIVMEKAYKAFTHEESAEKSGYSPFVFPDSEEGVEMTRLLTGQEAGERKRGIERNLESVFLEVFSADRGIFSVPRIRARGFPGALLLPGNAVGAYDMTGDRFLLPYSTTKTRSLEHVVNAVASFRWNCDESGRLLNVWSDLVGSRGARPMLELESSFRRAYSSWLISRIRGGEIEEHAIILGEKLKSEGDFARCAT